jgi:hypothetical protein
VQAATAPAALPIPAIAFAGANGTRVLTDTQGRFVFHDLPAGSYTVSVTSAGYVPGAYGQTRPNGPSKTLDLADGQRTSDVRMRVWKYAVITGTVQDETGQPAVGVTVRALRKTMTNGRARLVAANVSAATDDRGEFRLATLVPGDYVVAIAETQVTMPVPIVQAMTDTMMSGGRGNGMLDFVGSGGPAPSPEGLRVGDNLLQTSDLHRAPAPAVEGHLGAYVSLYFPAAQSPAQAAVLSMKSGEERGGVNMQLHLVSTATVNGALVGPEGPVANAVVKLTPVGVDEAGIDSGFESASTLTRADGSFTLLAVPAGQYTARAAKMPRVTAGRGNAAVGMAAVMFGAGGGASPGLSVAVYAQTPLTVRGTDVAGVDLQLREGAKLAGRIEFVGSAAPPQPRQLQNLSVILNPVDGRVYPQPFAAGPSPSTAVDASNQFKTAGNPPGRYTAAMGGPVPQGWVLKSILVNGRDVSTVPFELSTGDIDGAVVTFSDKVGQIAGTVKGVPVNGSATVLIFPFDYKGWINDGMSTRLLRQTPVGAAGGYSAGNLFGRDYYVVALDDADMSDNLDPATFDALSKVATHVALADGEKKTTVDLATVRIK